jgi:hypothetical protein
MGHKMVKMQPVHGFAAETTAAIILHATATIGVPVSTTHVISTSIMGVGATKRLSAVKWGVVQRIIWAWVLTLPVTALPGILARPHHSVATAAVRPECSGSRSGFKPRRKVRPHVKSRREAAPTNRSLIPGAPSSWT